ncbi:MAG: M48 family metalloprotease [Planctomycetes bacterium]|nr:M48 family metalloprotease [Planctomycetota bacterium]
MDSPLFDAIRFSGDDIGSVQGSSELHGGNTEASRGLLKELKSSFARVTSNTFPSLFKSIKNVADNLGQSSWEAFVLPDSRYKSACYQIEHEGASKCVVIMSGSLVKEFSEGGLKFVIGHEFGHSILKHHGYPRPSKSNTPAHNAAILELLRSSEFSADRVGLMASKSLQDSTNAIIQLASGLPADHIGDSHADFLLQNDEGSNEKWQTSLEDSTHPTLPLRAINLDVFSKTSSFQEFAYGVNEGLTIAECDERLYGEICKYRGGKLESLVGNSNFAELSSFWAVTALFSSGSRFSEKEQAWMSSRYGDRLMEGAKRFMREYGKESTKKAMVRFVRCCPLINDAKAIVKNTIENDIEEARQFAGINPMLAEKVLNTCLNLLTRF